MKIKANRDYFMRMINSDDIYYIRVIKVSDGRIYYNNYKGFNQKNTLDHKVVSLCYNNHSNFIYPSVRYVKNTKLARKMYPVHEVEGEFIVVEV